MNERGRVALILGAVAVVAGGGLFYFFKVHQPKQQRAAAQAEIATWEHRFTEARTCLFGAAPASGNSAEALAVREMMPDPWEKQTCTKLIGRLTRGVAEDTGLMPVEHAWMSIDRAAARVAAAFATHVDPFGEAIEKRGKASPLPAALEELDAAHADLHRAAGMAPPATSTLPTLRAAELIPITLGEARVKTIDSWSIPSGGAVIAFGATAKGRVQVVLAPGATPRVVPVPPGALRALPDLSWGAAGLMDEIAVSPVDSAGAFGAMTHLAVPGRPSILVAAGSLATGIVVAFDGDTGLVLARSSGGPFAADAPVPTTSPHATVDVAGRAFVAWSTPAAVRGDQRRDFLGEAGKLVGFITRGDAAPAIVELGTGYPNAMCLTDARGWLDAADQTISFDGAAAGSHVLPGHDLLGCTRSAALLHDEHNQRYAVCKDTCDVVTITGLRTTDVATIANDRVHAVRTRGRVLGVWRQNLPPRFFALPGEVTPLLADSDGKAIDVLVRTADGVAIVRVPV